MTFALKLNVTYIWNDSLCIVQDDPTDWDIESTKMADVYQNVCLTLSATASPGNSYGCYDEQLVAGDATEIHLLQDYPGTPIIAVQNSLQH
jgi:hypothetical protein